MSENVERQSATIYRFPQRGRFAAAHDDRETLSTKARPVKAVGGAWYHDAAIAEERER